MTYVEDTFQVRLNTTQDVKIRLHSGQSTSASNLFNLAFASIMLCKPRTPVRKAIGDEVYVFVDAIPTFASEGFLPRNGVVLQTQSKFVRSPTETT